MLFSIVCFYFTCPFKKHKWKLRKCSFVIPVYVVTTSLSNVSKSRCLYAAIRFVQLKFTDNTTTDHGNLQYNFYADDVSLALIKFSRLNEVNLHQISDTSCCDTQKYTFHYKAEEKNNSTSASIVLPFPLQHNWKHLGKQSVDVI